MKSYEPNVVLGATGRENVSSQKMSHGLKSVALIPIVSVVVILRCLPPQHRYQPSFLADG